MRIGVLGGTFDPIHLGHLAAAEEVREVLGLDRVVFVPSGHPPHKETESLLEASQRYAMAELALVGNPAFSVSRVEIDRKGPSYTVDTLKELQQQWPDAELYFITGADMFLDLPRWKGPDELLRLFHFVGVSRPGWNLAIGYEQTNLYCSHSDHVHMIEVPGVAISATEIRHRVRSGRSIRYLVPEAVRQYITEHSLYQ